MVSEGEIILFWCDFCTPQKEKFLVLSALDPYPLGFLINSKPTAFQAARQHLMDDLILLSRADYAHFLAHDSYLDCSCAVSDLKIPEIVARVGADRARNHKGSIRASDAERIARVLSESVNVEECDKRAAINGLRKAGLIL